MEYFDVYFELYGKKMKTTVYAHNKTGAKKIIREKIVFHKIVKKVEEECNPFSDTTFKDLLDMLGMNNK